MIREGAPVSWSDGPMTKLGEALVLNRPFFRHLAIHNRSAIPVTLLPIFDQVHEKRSITRQTTEDY